MSTYLQLLFLSLFPQVLQLVLHPFTGGFEGTKTWIQEEESTHISLRMKSNRVSTFCFASAWSCWTSTGPTSLYTVFFSVSDANSYHTRECQGMGG